MPKSKRKQSKPWYKKWWIWVIVGIVVLAIIGNLLPETEKEATWQEKYDAKKLVYDEIKHSYEEGKIKYWETLKISSLSNYEGFNNECGNGVVVSVADLAYWVVKEDMIYAINGFGKTYTPDVEYIKGEENTCLFSTYIS